MVAKVYEKLWTNSRPTVPFEEVRELLDEHGLSALH